MKFKITYEWEEEIDFEDFDPDCTPQEAMKNFEEWTIDEYYERLNTRAGNILPSKLKRLSLLIGKMEELLDYN